MPSLTTYRGLQVVTPDPTGDGGLAIQNDLKSLVDWSPKSVWAQSADPGVNDDSTQSFYPGSLWLRTDTSPSKLFVCQSSSAGAAVWKPVLLVVVQDAAPQLGGNLDVNGKLITSASNGHIVIDPNGTGVIRLAANTQIEGAAVIGASGSPTSTCDFLGSTQSWMGAACRWVGTGTGAHKYGIYVTSAGAWEFSDIDAGRTSLRISATGDTLLVPSAGNVGIGTPPSYPLHVKKDANATGQVVFENPNAGSGSRAILAVISNASRSAQFGLESVAYGGKAFVTTSASDLELRTSNVTRMTLKASGEIQAASTVKLKQTYRDIAAATDGTTVTFDLATSDMHSVTLGGNRTLALSNAQVGQKFQVTLTQDVAGSRTVSWWSGISWPGGTVPTLTTTAGKSDMFEFVCTGTGAYYGRVWGQAY